MGRMNVFDKDTYYPWTYPSNWWKNVRTFFRNIRFGWQRATKGFCDRDVWNLDGYYMDLFHVTLRHLAEHHYGFPGVEPFETDEKWTEFLYDLSFKFYQANEENEFFPTPCADKWCEWLREHPSSHPWNDKDDGEVNPYNAEMYEESKENWEKQKAVFDEAWKMLGEHFFSLWD